MQTDALAKAKEIALIDERREKTDWMHPANKVLIQQAVKAKLPIVTLRSGQVLTLKYFEEYEGMQRIQKVRIAPHKTIGHSSFVPRGVFPVSTIKANDWVLPKNG